MLLFHCIWWTSWKWFQHNIRKLIKDDKFGYSMNDLELHTWTLFVDVVETFLDNSRAENYKELVEKLLKSLQTLIRVVRLIFYIAINKFPDNCSDVSDEQGEQYHQNIKTMEEHYQWRWDKRMMADYYWSIKRDFNNVEQDNQARENFPVHEGFISAVSVEILSVNGFIEWSANIPRPIRGLFCIVFLLLLVSLCVRWKSVWQRSFDFIGWSLWRGGCCCPWRYPPKSTVVSWKMHFFTPQFKWSWITRIMSTWRI